MEEAPFLMLSKCLFIDAEKQVIVYERGGLVFAFNFRPVNSYEDYYLDVNTVGKYKVDVMKERVLDINPEAEVVAHKCFYLPETANQFDFTKYDYVVDCIDTVTGKLQLIEAAKAAGVSVISSMGAGNKLDPTAFEVADISKTSVCPLAKVMRRELKKRNIKNVKVVYSKEEPVEAKISLKEAEVQDSSRRSIPASCAFVPSVAGLILAGEVIKDLTGNNEKG